MLTPSHRRVLCFHLASHLAIFRFVVPVRYPRASGSSFVLCHINRCDKDSPVSLPKWTTRSSGLHGQDFAKHCEYRGLGPPALRFDPQENSACEAKWFAKQSCVVIFSFEKYWKTQPRLFGPKDATADAHTLFLSTWVWWRLCNMLRAHEDGAVPIWARLLGRCRFSADFLQNFA